MPDNAQPKLYFGKFLKKFPQQIENRKIGDEAFFAGGKPEDGWYVDMEPGDYVFPIYGGRVQYLLQVKGFANEKENESINSEGAMYFVVENIFDPPVRVSTQLQRYRHFNLDLNLLNKSMKQSKGRSFFQVDRAESCPSPEKIDLGEQRNIFLTTPSLLKTIDWKPRDLWLEIEPGNWSIKAIQRKTEQGWEEAKELWDLYQSKNPENPRHNLRQLLDYAKLDGAIRKENYLDAVLEQLKNGKPFQVKSPVQLYDNILVGRKVFFPKGRTSPSNDQGEQHTDGETADAPDELENYTDHTQLLKDCPNLILYGPPGTGKTYAAQRIVEAFYYDRNNVYREYKELQKDGLTTLITFHQAFSYEEFVEGIRPALHETNEDAQDATTSLKYEIRPGILKTLADKAAVSREQERIGKSGLDLVTNNSKVYKVSLGEIGVDNQEYEECKQNGEIANGYLSDFDLSNSSYNDILAKLKAESGQGAPAPTNNASTLDLFVNHMQEGDLVMVPHGNKQFRDIGVITGDYDFQKGKNFSHRRKVEWLAHFKKPIDIVGLNGGVRFTMKSVYHLWRIQPRDILELVQDDDASVPTSHKPQDAIPGEPHFLIIDEINRGNVARIFGEMITLLEKDKRGTIECTLPYSGKPFTLPQNLFLIGTMNTADRSIAVLDTALRRRFVFREVEPNPELITSDITEVGCDPKVILERLNGKLSQKLDRDHRIGHAEFMNVHSISQLNRVWFSRVMPQLMEFFYNNGPEIADIVGEKFFLDVEQCNPKWEMTNTEFQEAMHYLNA